MVGGGQGAFIGAVHRIASRIDDRYELVAGAFSSDAERALASGKELGISEDRNYQNFQEMAEKESHREDKIDAVAIVTPNHMHHPIAMEFMKKGFHIICDKPLAMNLKQCEELVQASQTNNILFALTHNYTGYPMVRNAKAMCENGDIGNIRVIQAEYAQDWIHSLVFYFGLLIFFIGMYINIKSDYLIVALRREKGPGYHLPNTFMHKYISAPNYFGEIVEWIGWAVLTWSISGFVFALWTIANLFPRALAHHRWYQAKFSDYPKNRKAIIPGII